jgi:hypothetical protein
MQIKKHDRSHMVELRNGFAWRIWPGDIPKTLQWRPTTEIDIADIEDEICSHALIDRSNGSRVEKICRTYGKNFYEAVEVCQAAALCEDSAVRKRNLDTLDAEIDAFNNLIAVQCIGS